ncbi:hypothetical protein MYG64_35600 (plasmid) [Ensifer adhaerens]|uniref:hypothetical protein n=1 Tax=Ensifer adhaerens TaxID=106592 RepID=UPI002101B43F|nr:hypothetical protein [Ensifer adhaerens]UTV41835.1 hypothetical protein MYG64_35600 [Ensifer adhaerens]
MLNENRQQYVIQTNDAKGEEGVGKAMGAIVLFVIFLAAIQYAYEAVLSWYRETIAWVSETAAYVGSFWPL